MAKCHNLHTRHGIIDNAPLLLHIFALKSKQQSLLKHYKIRNTYVLSPHWCLNECWSVVHEIFFSNIVKTLQGNFNIFHVRKLAIFFSSILNVAMHYKRKLHTQLIDMLLNISPFHVSLVVQFAILHEVPKDALGAYWELSLRPCKLGCPHANVGCCANWFDKLLIRALVVVG